MTSAALEVVAGSMVLIIAVQLISAIEAIRFQRDLNFRIFYLVSHCALLAIVPC